MIDTAWDQRIDDFYEHDFNESDPQNATAKMRSLVAERPSRDAAALFRGGIANATNTLAARNQWATSWQNAVEALTVLQARRG